MAAGWLSMMVFRVAKLHLLELLPWWEACEFFCPSPFSALDLKLRSWFTLWYKAVKLWKKQKLQKWVVCIKWQIFTENWELISDHSSSQVFGR
jgi:hypothetical protein